MAKQPARRRLQFSLKTLFVAAMIVGLGSCIFVLMSQLNHQKEMLQVERAEAAQLREIAEQIRIESTVQLVAARSDARQAQEEQKRALDNLVQSKRQSLDLVRRALAEAGVTNEQAEEILRRLTAENKSKGV